MLTEELNDYSFTALVMKHAWSARCRRVNALEDAGKITAEQAKNSPQNTADVREALTALRHNKKVVFDILSELELDSAALSAPAQADS